MQNVVVVSLGGGSGQATMLRVLKRFTDKITAVVAVTDDGGSSGRLREELGVIPPGDIRNCITALAEDESLMAQLMSYRFDDRSVGLDGHSLGNLLIVALCELTGDFLKAVKAAGEVLAIRGRVLPATDSDVRLQAQLVDGTIVEGETAIVEASRRKSQAIRRVSLIPADPDPCHDVIKAIDAADIILIGPGSLYTSIMPNFLVPGIAEAISRSSAVKILIVNVMTQPGETDGFTASMHVKAVMDHVPCRVFDYALVNTTPPRIPTLLARYAGEGSCFVEPDTEKIVELGYRLIEGDFVSESDFIRHDPNKVIRKIAHSVLGLDLL